MRKYIVKYLMYKIALKEPLDSRKLSVSEFHRIICDLHPNPKKDKDVVTIQTLYNYYNGKIGNASIKALGYIVEGIQYFDKSEDFTLYHLLIDGGNETSFLRKATQHFRLGNLRFAQTDFNNALQHTESSSGDKVSKIKALNGLGNVALAKGDPSEAGRWFTNALKTIVSDFEPNKQTDSTLIPQIAFALSGLGDVDRLTGYYKASWKKYQDAIDWIRNHSTFSDRPSEYREQEAWALWGQGEVFRYQGDFMKAFRHQRQARTIFESLEEKGQWSLGTCINMIGILFYSLDKADTAHKYFEESSKLDRLSHNLRNEAYSINHLANTTRKLNTRRPLGHSSITNISEEIFDAQQQHMKALHMFTEMGDQIGVAYTKLYLAHQTITESILKTDAFTAIPHDYYERALAYCHEAYKQFETYSNQRGMIYTELRRGYIYKAIGEYDLAFNFFDQAYTKLKELRRQNAVGTTEDIGDKIGELSALKNMSYIYMRSGDTKKSKKILDEDIPRIRMTDGNKHQEYIVFSTHWRSQGDLFLTRANNLLKEAKTQTRKELLETYRNAEAFFKAAHDLFVVDGDQQGEANSYEGMAKVKLEAPFFEGLNIKDQLTDPEVGLRYYYVAHRLFEGIGNSRRAEALENQLRKSESDMGTSEVLEKNKSRRASTPKLLEDARGYIRDVRY